MAGVIPQDSNVAEYVNETQDEWAKYIRNTEADYSRATDHYNKQTALFVGPRGIKVFCTAYSKKIESSFTQCQEMGLARVNFKCPHLYVHKHIQDVMSFLVSIPFCCPVPTFHVCLHLTGR